MQQALKALTKLTTQGYELGLRRVLAGHPTVSWHLSCLVCVCFGSYGHLASSSNLLPTFAAGRAGEQEVDLARFSNLLQTFAAERAGEQEVAGTTNLPPTFAVEWAGD